MRRRRLLAVLLLSWGLLSVAVEGSASPVCESELPGNIHTNVLDPNLVQLVRQSATVHQQCQRIAATPWLHIQVTVVHQLDFGGRAEARIAHYDAGAIRVEIAIRFGDDYVELLAHEFEHVLEQIERVDLRQEAVAHRAWQLPEGAYETRRAIEAGIRARQEVDAVLAAEAAQRAGRKVPLRRHPFD